MNVLTYYVAMGRYSMAAGRMHAGNERTLILRKDRYCRGVAPDLQNVSHAATIL